LIPHILKVNRCNHILPTEPLFLFTIYLLNIVTLYGILLRIMETVTLKLAQLARKHGFDENCQFAISAEGDESSAFDLMGCSTFTVEDIINAGVNTQIDFFLQPYLVQLQRWFIKEHNIVVLVDSVFQSIMVKGRVIMLPMFWFKIYHPNSISRTECIENRHHQYETLDKALLNGLLRAFKLLNE
jgi:hypothetical protein